MGTRLELVPPDHQCYPRTGMGVIAIVFPQSSQAALATHRLKHGTERPTVVWAVRISSDGS